MRTYIHTYTLRVVLLNLICWFGGICSLGAQTSALPDTCGVSPTERVECESEGFEQYACIPADSIRTDSMVSVPVDSIGTTVATGPTYGENIIDTAALTHLNDSLLSEVELPQKRFVPNPQRAMWLALVFPGAGQVYNRKYWKIPIVYGGFLGCVYAFSWNSQMYRDYSQAYLDIMDNDPNTKSYEGMLPLGYSIEGREERFKDIFKRKKNFYRRYRDMSIFCMIAVYALSVVDAYVDAELSSFDISKDLSMRIEPKVFNHSRMSSDGSASVGVQCTLNF